MNVRCRLCGGDNTVRPGQRMVTCAFCGSALALGEKEGPEQLILPHERTDRGATEALVSHLAERGLALPRGIPEVSFAYVPYAMATGERGTMETTAIAAAPRAARSIPWPPAGAWRFFDEALAGGEEIVPAGEIPGDAIRLLWLPLYTVRYRAAGKTRTAAIFGDSWLVLATDWPPGRPQTLDTRNVLLAAGLFVAYLFIGRLGAGLPARLVVIASAATTGWLALAARRRLAGRSNG
ncbi:MAG: hypothetical protein JW876_06135 [Candidatus Krumholzibacteriota bacterium]|nr:hypothetical protein [Candidatus Krumholzibacteriota bacterium]